MMPVPGISTPAISILSVDDEPALLESRGIAISETGMPGEGARFEIRVPKGGFRIQPSKEKRISN